MRGSPGEERVSNPVHGEGHRDDLGLRQAELGARLADAVEGLATAMFAPVSRSHRITVDQMAMLEPALTETLTNGCVAIIREGLERVVDLGVPAEAAHDFLMGHLQIGIALIFEQLDWKLSEGAQLALEQSKDALFKDDWHAIFEPEAVLASCRQITGGD